MIDDITELIDRYKADSESVYNTWFVAGGERLKAFRTIRRGVRNVVDSIYDGSFGSDFKGSPLEFVLHAITEQKQVFYGAAHPFYWKPKLRIPDIYEQEANKRSFAEFLDACLSATTEEQVLAAMIRLGTAGIRGLGPAVASIVYFLHPTFVLPSNTAIVRGFNSLYGEKLKLGDWKSYLTMREVVVETNRLPGVRTRLSNDLGAFAGLLFEIGAGRLLTSGNADAVLATQTQRAVAATRRRHEEVVTADREVSEHTQMQYDLIQIGRDLGLDVFVASNDRHRTCNGTSFKSLTIHELPARNWPPDVESTVQLIDVIWLEPGTGRIVSAFEVEKSTSIYSGILRMEDLALSIPDCICDFYLVAPDDREKEVMAQLTRPALRDHTVESEMSYISFGDIREYREGLAKLGDDHTIMRKLARRPVRGDRCG